MMKLGASFAALLALIPLVTAQSGAYGQCGGQGWTGPTTCIAGWTCTYSNPYYSQCLQGSGSSTATPTTTPTGTATSTSASATSTATHCGQWDTVVSGQYTMYLDQWGMSNASSGSDCATITSLSGTTIAWSTTWTWNGGSGVKSFTNIALDAGINQQLSAITSIPVTWKWSQTSTGTEVADIAWDLFTSTTSGGSNVNEIMIWLANINAGPISATYSSSGSPEPVASNLSLAGQTWDLYSGSNGSNQVYSFLPASGSSITSFSGDLNVFLKYLTANEGVSTSQYLTTLQAGTEATSGSATLTTTAYSAVINA